METPDQFSTRVMTNWMEWIDNYQRMTRLQFVQIQKRKYLNKVRFLASGSFAKRIDVEVAQKELATCSRILNECRKFHREFSFQMNPVTE